jgi:hypothetical protein
MHRPIHLKESEAAVVPATYRRMGELAFSSCNVQRRFLQLIRPDLADDGSGLLSAVPLSWHTDDGASRDTHLVTNEDWCSRCGPIEIKRASQ